MVVDNGSPWGSSDAEHRHTWLNLWLLELGVAVSHGRPYHPQTQGKSLPRRRPGTSCFIPVHDGNARILICGSLYFAGKVLAENG